MAYDELKTIIAALCDDDPDHASEQNGIGPQKCDTNFFHFLNDQEKWKPKWAAKVHHNLRKYKNTQIPALGLNYDEIPVPGVMDADGFNSTSWTIADLETELNWSAPKRVNTKQGPRILRKAPPTEDFWKLWKAQKDAIKAAGYSVGQYNGYWEVTHWGVPEEEEAAPVVVKAPTPTFTGLANTAPLYDYQVPHANALARALAKHGVALDGSDTGTGKTPCTTVVVRELDAPVLVICPLAVVTAWEKWLKRAGVHEDKVLGFANYDLARLGKMRVQAGVYKSGPSKGQVKHENVDCPYIVRESNPKAGEDYEPKYIFTFKVPAGTIVIFDEAHRCKNRKTQNTQLLKSAKDSGARILMLTATLGEDPLKLDAPGYALGLHQSKWDFYRWAGEHQCSKGRYGWKFHGGGATMRAIHDEIFNAGKGSRMRVSELIEAGKFPTSQVIAEAYDLNGNTAAINKAYAEMASALAKLEQKKAEISGAPLSIRQKARQEVELLKVPMIVDMAQELIEEGHSVVIFVNFTQTIDELAAKLDTRCIIDGRVSQAVKEANRVAFFENRQRIVICNTAAAREGIDLHDISGNYPRVSLITPGDSAQDLKQALGRVWRAGGGRTQQRILFAAGTIEEQVCENVQRKIALIAALNDGPAAIPLVKADLATPAELPWVQEEVDAILDNATKATAEALANGEIDEETAALANAFASKLRDAATTLLLQK